MASGNQTGVPALNVPFVSTDGRIGIPWYRFLINLWNRTGGSISTLFILASPPTASGQVPVYNGTTWNPETIGGDATLSGTGELEVSSTHGVAFAPSATIDTTNATHITSGVLEPSVGGTGINNNTHTIQLSGNLSIVGSAPVTLNLGGSTNLNLPTSGTLLNNQLANDNILIGNGSGVTTAVVVSGDATLSNTGVLTLDTINPDIGAYTNPSITVNAKGLITSASNGPTGISVTVTTAKLTAGGTNGSMTFVNGILTAQTQAT
jgi:hypothetical protein